MKLKIVVPVNTSDFNAGIEAAAREVLAPDVTLAVENIRGGFSAIESRLHLATNAPFVLDTIQRAEAEGFEGVFVSDMDMCGVEAARELAEIPVIGGYRASAFTAMLLAESFSIVTVVDSVIAMQRGHAKAFGIEQNLASIRAVDLPVAGLSGDHAAVERVTQASLEAIRRDGAQAIILGCTGFVGVAAEVSRRLRGAGRPAPVIDPNHAAISYLQNLVRTGQSQSRLSYFKKSRLD